MNNPLISITIPNYNRADLIGETLDSIMAQTYSNWECIIVDDGSTDYSEEVIQTYVDKDSRFQLHNRPNDRPKGANTCRNYGFELSKGAYVIWFDSDDLMLKSLLQSQLDLIMEGYDGVVVNCEVWSHDFSKKIRVGWRSLFYSENILKDYLKTRLAWQTGCGLWKKSSIKGINPFSENIGNAQEWVFHLKIIVSGMNIILENSSFVRIRKHKESISGKKSASYLNNRVKSRVIAFREVHKSKNSGKKYILKSILHMGIRYKQMLSLSFYKNIFNILIIVIFSKRKKKKSISNFQLND